MIQQPTTIRLQYEQTLTICSRCLLSSFYEEDPLIKVLTYLQQAISVSKISLFENFTDAKRGLCTRCIYQVGSNATQLSKQPPNQDWTYQPELSRWETLLSSGKLISGKAVDFPSNEQEILQALKTLSLLVIPIEVAKCWYGFICFNDISVPREWNADDIYLGNSAVELIGIYLSRRQKERIWRELMFDPSMDVQCIIGFDGIITQLTSASKHAIGYGEEQLLDKSYLSFLHPEDWDATQSMFQKLLQGEYVRGFENRYRCQDNSYHWFSWNAYPLVEQKKIYTILCDITKQKQNEIARLDAHERLLTILDSLDSFVYVADMQTYELLYVNKYGQNTVGKIKEGQLCWKTLHHGQKLPCITCCNAKLLNDKGEPTGVITNEIQDKKTGKWYLTYDHAIQWMDRRLVRLQIATDITERKSTQKALKINEHRYQAIVQDQTELICCYLPDGRLSFVNEAYCRYFHKTEAELIGHILTPFVFDPMQDVISQMMENLTRETPVEETEHRTILNNEERWQHWIGRAVFDETGKLVEYQVVGRDITERKRAEEELRRAKEAAEAATRAKSEFLANMSHEIRTPLNGVVGMTELLLNTELSLKQREYAEIIHQSTDALQTLINDILDFSKIEAQKLTLELASFDLEEAVFEIVRLLSMSAESKGIELIVRYAPDAPHQFVGDAGRIRQILTNLVGNAIKFTSKGHVLINVDCQLQTLDFVGMSVQIEDTGIGIPAEKRDSIFEEFTQADASTTRQFGGTGLGLAISQRLVKMMGGEIGVVSKLGKGSIFTFTLPLPLEETYGTEKHSKLPIIRNSDAQNLATSAIKTRQLLQNTRILVVDDNQVNQRILSEQLENLQIRVQTVDSAKAALKALRKAVKQQDPYWLAIVDFLMPVIDGEQLGQFIKQDPEIKDTMLVMLSSAGYQRDRSQLQKAGFFAHLVKPLSQHKLQQVLLTLRSAFNSFKSQDETISPRDFITTKQVDKFQFKRHPKRYPNLPILLVEDIEVNRMVAVSMLEQLGCRVTQAENGVQALKILEQHHFALVFMDIQMPEMDGLEATRKIREREAQQVQKTQNPHTLIIAMTANAMQGDAENCFAAGMDDYLAKPISLERIFEVLNKYCSSYQTNQTQSPNVDLNKRETPHPGKREIFEPFRAKKILLVEDNPINCMVTTHMLEELGCSVEVAENGKQAVDICLKGDYDLILMDILMPVMDGIDATKLIRQQNNSIPIIATTTNNWPDDIKRYLAAGMNDCLNKPLTVERLSFIVKKYTLSISSNTSFPPYQSSPSALKREKRKETRKEKERNETEELPIFDAEQAKRIAIGNLSILQKIINKFLQDSPKQIDKLEEALQADIQKEAERFAHSLKGSARSVGALRLGEVAFIAETAAKQGDLVQVKQLLSRLRNEFAQLQDFMKQIDWKTLL